jgi:Sulfotransferase domain
LIYGIKTVAKYLLGTDIAGRRFAVFPDDTMLVSYPRSGNTWTRFLIANLMHPGEEVSFINIERLIPDTSSQSSRALKKTPRPRLIKTHEYFDHRYEKVIYVVRDPRDVAVSYYHFLRKVRQFDDDCSMERFVEDFIRGRGRLIDEAWGSWGENVASWIYTRGDSKDFLLCRYEDLLENPVRELSRIALFMGLEAKPELLQQAVERSSADRMRAMEKLQSEVWVVTKDRRKDVPFVGTAKSGGWRKTLTEKCVLQIEHAWGELMVKLDYELARTARSQSSSMAVSGPEQPSMPAANTDVPL